jgi:hypothetical protein
MHKIIENKIKHYNVGRKYLTNYLTNLIASYILAMIKMGGNTCEKYQVSITQTKFKISPFVLLHLFQVIFGGIK